MAAVTEPSRDTERRAAILTAARACFLRFGYAKTSLADIAKEARLSRPLLYLQFRSKEDIFSGVFEELFAERYPAVERILAERGSVRVKLMRAYELLVLEPWDQLVGMPGAEDFFNACEAVCPEAEAEYTRRRLRYTAAILGRKDVAELFSLAVDGLQSDFPSSAVLRRRLALLIERFT
jgi:AcrR family transcriptional regulator